MTTNPIEEICQNNPEHISIFQKKVPLLEMQCNEVEHIVRSRIHSSGIPIAHVTSRVKSLSSFCEKILRKKYKNPFHDMTDLSGIRIVYLYPSDREEIEKIIEEEFEIIEKIDKLDTKKTDKFGYDALHYIAKIKNDSTSNKNLVFELQVRTVLQDSWAIIEHHLAYKSETDIPQELRRTLNALSGMFVIADNTFENIRDERSLYQEKVEEEISTNTDISLDQEINLDNLIAFIKWKFPERKQPESEGTADLLKELKQFKYENISDINTSINRAIDAAIAYEKDDPPQLFNDEGELEPGTFNGVGIIRTVMELTNPKYAKYRNVSEQKIESYSHLIKKK